MRSVFFIGLVALLIAPLSIAEQGEQEDIEDLLALSLEQLLTIKVVSKTAETITRSPAIVSTHRADSLINIGLGTLKDFIDFIPSVEVNEALNGSRIVQMRGLPSRSNQKILFLIDGVPYWAPENGDIPLLSMPLDAIERIEVIRGPGAVVYGTNASAGVINIIPRRDEHSSVALLSDIEEKARASFYHSVSTPQDLDFTISGEIQDDKGYDFQVENTFNIDPPFSFAQTLDGEMERKSDYYSVYSGLKWRGFELSLQAHEEELLGSVNSSVLTKTWYRNIGRFASLKYLHEFKNGELEVFADWNQLYRKVTTDDLLTLLFIPGGGEISFDNNGDNNDRFRQGISFKYGFTDHWSMLMGLEYERRRTENQKFKDDVDGDNLRLLTQPPIEFPYLIQPDNSILLIEEDSIYEKSGYLQTEYLDDVWRFVIGGRFVDNNQIGSDVSPRSALVYSLSDKESIKLLYSEGFNTPTFSQLAATDSFGLPNDSEVDAERVKSWDLAYTHSDEQDHYVFGIYRVEVEGLIFDNENLMESILRNGVEIEWLRQSGAWKHTLGLSYVHQGGEEADMQSSYASKWLAKWGLVYQNSQHTFGTSIRSSGPRKEAGVSHYINARYAYSVSNDLAVSLTLQNLLDERGMQPNVRLLNDILLQSEERFGATLGLTYDFD